MVPLSHENDDPVIGDLEDPLLAVESLHAPVYVTIIQRHKQADFFNDPHSDYEKEAFHRELDTDHNVEPKHVYTDRKHHRDIHNIKINDKFDSGYYSTTAPLYYSPKPMLRHNKFGKDADTFIQSNTHRTKDKYYHEPKFYDVTSYTAKPKTGTPYIYDLKPKVTVNPLQHYNKNVLPKQHSQPPKKSYSHINSKLYTHTPKPKYDILKPPEQYENNHYIRYTPVLQNDLHRIPVLHKTPIPRKPFNIEIIHEKEIPLHKHPRINPKHKYIPAEKAIYDVKSEFKKGAKSFDHNFSKPSPIRAREEDHYTVTNDHDSKLHPIKSHSVGPLPPPYTHRQKLPYYPRHKTSYSLLPHNERPIYHYEPDAYVDLEHEIEYDLDPHYDDLYYEYFEKPEYHLRKQHYARSYPAHLHYPRDVYDHAFKSGKVLYEPSVSTKGHLVSKSITPHLKSTTFKTLPPVFAPFSFESNKKQYSKLISTKQQAKSVQSKNFIYPTSFVIQSHSFPKFSGPKVIQLKIENQIKDNFNNLTDLSTYNVPPFPVSESEERREEEHFDMKEISVNSSPNEKGISSSGSIFNQEETSKNTEINHIKKFKTKLLKSNSTKRLDNFLIPAEIIKNVNYSSNLLASMLRNLSNAAETKNKIGTSEEVIFIILNNENELNISSHTLNGNSQKKKLRLAMITTPNTVVGNLSDQYTTRELESKHNITGADQLGSFRVLSSTFIANETLRNKERGFSNKSVIKFPISIKNTTTQRTKRKFVQILLDTVNMSNRMANNKSKISHSSSPARKHPGQNSDQSFFSLPDVTDENNMPQKLSMAKKMVNIPDVITAPPEILSEPLFSSQPQRLTNSYPLKSSGVTATQVTNAMLYGGVAQKNVKMSYGSMSRPFKVTRYGGNRNNNTGSHNGSGSQRDSQNLRSMRPTSDCHCELSPKLDPRRRFSPKFVNATSVVRNLLQ